MKRIIKHRGFMEKDGWKYSCNHAIVFERFNDEKMTINHNDVTCKNCLRIISKFY